jgi:hypothetical protein
MKMHESFNDFDAGNHPLWDRLGRGDGVPGTPAEDASLSDREISRLRFHQWRLKEDCEAQVAPHDSTQESATTSAPAAGSNV